MATRMDGYVRVSRVAGREGNGFIAPEVQREKIEQWAALHDVELGEVVEELDVSGAKAPAERGLERLLSRCEAGESAGVVCHRVDRFGRSAVDTLLAVRRLNEANARLVGVADGVDSSTEFGAFAIGLLSLLAERELDRVRGNWSVASGSAVARGIHISGRVPAGYERDDETRILVPKEPEASAVRWAFAARADGATWAAICAGLKERGCLPSAKRRDGEGRAAEWTVRGARKMIMNRVYLGEARGPNGAVNPTAHEPLVTVAEWEAAQLVGLPHGRDGSVAARTLLTGLLHCDGCGHRMSVTGGGKRGRSYYCRGRWAEGLCPAPASGLADRVDDFVAEALSVAILDGTVSTTMDAVKRYRRAEQAVTKAQADLDALADPRLLAAFGVERLAAMGEEQKQILRDAKRALRDTPKPGDAILPMNDLWDPETWPVERQRELARQFISEVRLTRGGKGRWSPPVEERLAITWAGEDSPDETVLERVEKMRADLPGRPVLASSG